MVKSGYAICAKYSIIKIDDKYYVQKEGVIMGASFAPNLANTTVLITLIRNEIYSYKIIKLNLRQCDDTLFIFKRTKEVDIKYIFDKYYPSVLKFTSNIMKNNTITFLDMIIIRCNNSLQYAMRIKPLKLVFYLPYQSNHPMYMKINVIQNMVKRAVILNSNKLLFIHTMHALRIRFQRSGYPQSFLFKYMDESLYEKRNEIINQLHTKRCNTINNILMDKLIKYKPISRWDKKCKNIPILYDELLTNNDTMKNMKKHLHKRHPDKRIVLNMNDSLQKRIRCKDATYNTM